MIPKFLMHWTAQRMAEASAEMGEHLVWILDQTLMTFPLKSLATMASAEKVSVIILLKWHQLHSLHINL